VSPDELQKHRENLEAFQAAYLVWRDGQGGRLPPHELEAAWQRVHEMEPAASRALDASGREITHTTPPFLGGDTVPGLSAYLIAFSTYGGSGGLDAPLRSALVQVIAELRQREAEERARRRKPSYWADRVFRAMVSPVGYVIRVLSGVDVRQQPILGPLSRIASLVFEGMAAFAAGRGLGWW
jgi:hypothetical protein